jgi:pimeloyl-ACP methyl ester carboxylesterase
MSRADAPHMHWIEHPPEQGGGRDVVLLHGLGSSAEDWLLQAPVLQDRHRVMAVDLPGFGKSARLRGWPRMQDYAGAVDTAMTNAGIRAAHVVGLSLGGAVALQLGMDRPGRVLSLILVNSFARRGVRPGVVMRTGWRFVYVLAGRMDRVGDWVAQELFPKPEQIDVRRLAADRLGRTHRWPYLQAGQAIARFDVRHRLGEIRCPTLIVAGDRDSLIPLSAKEEMARTIPGARLVVVPGSGHATPIDDAQAFNQLLEEFLGHVETVPTGQGPGLRWSDDSPARRAT